MIVRNWMKRNPVTVTGDTLVSETEQILAGGNLHALPVVENGSLRGLITRASCLRAADFVSRTQDPDEFSYFVRRLKVKDLMVRNPATIEATDTLEHCLRKGQELGVAQFPVMEAGRVVGLISANEIFTLAAHFLGAWEKRSGITLAPIRLGAGVLGKITDIAEAAGAVLQAIYPISDGAASGEQLEKKVIIRFHANDVAAVSRAYEEAGFVVLEATEASPHGH